MRVKQLQIQGFKSFKDKTVVRFDHQVTGVVGPNGCGKSNIVDAFFWVMGEQSYKHMRGTGTQDLIFNGSSKYSPSGMAEGTLTLEVTDADPEISPSGASSTELITSGVRKKDIAITRRVYRSGEGEYFINGVSCRLKDIQEFFLDTGVGAKGYSIIEQGQIGKIVNSKPEDRRSLIEDAAGIAKYKLRKKESLKKIEIARANLSRLNDLIQEIERSLTSLERQAQKAARYKELRSELVDKETRWSRRKVRSLRKAMDRYQQEKSELEHTLESARAQLATLEVNSETSRLEQVELQNKLDTAQNHLQQLSSDLTREQSLLELSRQRHSDLLQQKDRVETQAQEIQDQLAVDLERQETMSVLAQSMSAEVESARDHLAQLEAKVRNEKDTLRAHELQVVDARRELHACHQKTSELRAKQASFLSREEQCREAVSTLHDQEAQINQDLLIGQEEQSVAHGKLDEAEALVAASQARLQESIDEHRELSSSWKLLDQELSRVRTENVKAKAKLDSLLELNAAGEGLSEGAKKLINGLREGGAYHGLQDRVLVLLGEIDIAQGSEALVSAALADQIDTIIAKDHSAVSELIQLTAGSFDGRFPLWFANNNHELPRKNAFIEQDGLSPILDLISTKTPESKKFCDSLLGDTFVVDQLANWITSPAISDLVAKNPALRLIDQSGAIWSVNQGLFVLGQSSKKSAAERVIERQRDITRARSVLDESSELLSQVELRSSELRCTLDEIESARTLADANLRSQQNELVAIRSELYRCDQNVQQLSNRRGQILSDRVRNADRLSDASLELQTISELLVEAETNAYEAEQKLTLKEEELQAFQAAQSSSDQEAQGKRLDLVSLDVRHQSLCKELSAIEAAITNAKRRLVDSHAMLQGLTDELESKTGGQENRQLTIDQLVKSINEAKQDVFLVKDRLEFLSASSLESSSQIRDLHRSTQGATEAAGAISVAMEKALGELTFVVQSMEDKYGAGCLDDSRFTGQLEFEDPIVPTELSAEEEAQLTEDVETLREKIRRLGEVNLAAMEEYEETKKRFDHLVRERADLDQSICNLEEAIEHINKTSEDRFRKTFEAIAERYERLCPIVFGGGRAKLTLVYPEGSNDILEAGVDLLAQPPGKTILNIGALSGGEKALTALALIFSIFMVKPSPFCLLDEVDAPLDDANIGKFNALLREMSAKSQFIVITHNKKTMELNDALYGVTMEEPGVSKVVSIELR